MTEPICESARPGRARGSSLAVVVAALVASLPAAAQEAGDATELRRQLDRMRAQMQAMEERLHQVEHRAEEAEAKAGADAAPRVTSGNDRVQLSISGHINRAALYATDGRNDEFFHVDNAHSGSRVRFEGRAKFDDDISAGTNLEVQLRTNRSNRVNQSQKAPNGETTFDRRRVELFLASETYGRIWLGHGPTATDGIVDADLSGTGVVNAAAAHDLAGGMFFFDKTAGAVSNVAVRHVFDDLNGLGRDDRLRYDSPSFHGFMVSGSTVSNGAADVALRYGARFDGTRVALAAGYGAASTHLGYDVLGGSASILFENGFNLTLAGSKQMLSTTGRSDPWYGYAKVGWQGRPFTFGRTAVSIDYWHGRHFGMNGDRSRAYGAAVTQTVDRIGTELYLGARRYTLARAGVDMDPVDGAMSGARIRF